MSEKGKNIKQYTAADIRQYLEGKLSAAEMHAIEKAAMEDPFLADAIEGMEIHMHQNRTVSFEEDTQELRSKLNERVGKDRKIILFVGNVWLKAAAVLVVIISGVAITLNILERNNSEKPELAKTERFKDSVQKDDMVKVAPQSKDGYYDTTTSDQQAAGTARMPEADNNIAKTETKTEKEKVLNPARVKAPVDETASSISDINDPSVAAKPEAKSEEPPLAKSQQRALEGKAAGVNIETSDKRRSNLLIRGRVVDAQGNPVESAIVQEKNKNVGTVTDKDGMFHLESRTDDSSIEVDISSVGYERESRTLNRNDSSANIISLKPADAALSEVVVTGYGKAKKQREKMFSKGSTDIRERIIPAGGWDAFDDYIIKNKNISTADSVIKGNEAVSFLVNEEGRPVQIKIERSLSAAHDAEAIRLLSEGPSWKVVKGKQRKMNLIIIF